MKKLFLILLACSSCYAKDVGMSITEVTSLGVGTVAAKAKVVTFIFDSPCDVRIAGIANIFTGSSDVPSFTLVADEGDMLTAINYNVLAGGLRILRIQ